MKLLLLPLIVTLRVAVPRFHGRSLVSAGIVANDHGGQ